MHHFEPPDVYEAGSSCGLFRRKTNLLVASLVDAGEAVVPGEAVGVYPGPEEAEAAGESGDEEGEGSAAHLGAGGVFVGEGAETDAGVAHAGSGVCEGEEEDLIERGEDEERQAGRGGDGGYLRGDSEG